MSWNKNTTTQTPLHVAAAEAGTVRPGVRARFVRRGLCCAHQGQAQPPDSDRRRGSAAQHGPPRRLRLRAEHGRRRRHPHRPAARVSQRSRASRSWAPSCRRRASLPPASCFCRTIAAERAQCKTGRRGDHRRSKANGWSAGGKVPTETDKADIGPTAKAGEPHHRAARHRRGQGLRGRRLRAAALPHPQAGQPPAARRRVARASARCFTSARCRPR